MKDKQQVTIFSKGVGAAFILTAIFLVLKLCHVIDWSWWLVLLPMLIDIGFDIICCIVLGILILIAAIKDKRG